MKNKIKIPDYEEIASFLAITKWFPHLTNTLVIRHCEVRSYPCETINCTIISYL